ncbi:MAG TPA: hypothetical protein DIW51_15050 [Rhodospirillaceae bacterium]|nr:hypothetical protein [Magnetovibrio sp.]HBT40998.1 hypothetical protein [Rhodospirillaceae bacterium]HCS71278.1 hypothetical protein [Rhodospirillaceae bacterium]|tara:strand:- start:188 stop:505 length:318 start_codon:yes stop_codon:yes gene_type:complete
MIANNNLLRAFLVSAISLVGGTAAAPADAAQLANSELACTDEMIQKLSDATEEVRPNVDPKLMARLEAQLKKVRDAKEAGKAKLCRTEIILDIIVLEKFLGRPIK